MGEKLILFPLLSDLQKRQLGQNLLSLSLSLTLSQSLSLSLSLFLNLSLLSVASQESHGSRMGSLTLNLFFYDRTSFQSAKLRRLLISKYWD